jgi:hypothetical protein
MLKMHGIKLCQIDIGNKLYEAQFGLANSIINPGYKSPLFWFEK